MKQKSRREKELAGIIKNIFLRFWEDINYINKIQKAKKDNSISIYQPIKFHQIFHHIVVVGSNSMDQQIFTKEKPRLRKKVD